MPKICQETLEVLVLQSSPKVEIGATVVEALMPYVTPDPITVSGAGVSQYLIEVLAYENIALAHITQDIVEVLIAPDDSYSGSRPVIQTWVSVF